MGPDPLLSASLPLPLALSTTLQDNYLSLVRQGKGVKLNSHWLSLIAFLDLLDYKLNWRTWRAVLEVRRLSTCENACVRERVCVCGCIYSNQLLHIRMHFCPWSPRSSRGEPGCFSAVYLGGRFPIHLCQRQTEFLIRPYQRVCVCVRSLNDSCYCIRQIVQYTDIQRNTHCCSYALLPTSQAAKRKRHKQDLRHHKQTHVGAPLVCISHGR